MKNENNIKYVSGVFLTLLSIIIFISMLSFFLSWSSDQSEIKTIFDSSSEIKNIGKKFGLLISKYVNQFIIDFSVPRIDLISSHGHTVFHEPEKGLTLQIGDGKVISQKTRTKVVCNFRAQDVNLGGQGAPLVPIGDLNLFMAYKFCLNLGGFANISIKTNDPTTWN